MPTECRDGIERPDRSAGRNDFNVVGFELRKFGNNWLVPNSKRLIVKKAYQIGAKLVEVMWEDDQTRLFRYQYAPKDSFEEYPTWRTEGAFN